MEEIDLSAVEEITITHFNDQEQVILDRVDAEFSQYDSMRGEERKFTIFNNVHCFQSVHVKHRAKVKYRVNLTFVSPKPIRKFSLADGWLIAAAIGLVISFLLIYLGWFSDQQLSLPQSYLWAATALCLTLTILGFLMAWLKTEDRVYLVSRFGRIPVFEFFNKNPDRKSFEEFLELLGRHIIHAQHAAGLDDKDRCTLELRELRRLRDEQVISDARYESGKKRIFNHRAFKA